MRRRVEPHVARIRKLSQHAGTPQKRHRVLSAFWKRREGSNRWRHWNRKLHNFSSLGKDIRSCSNAMFWEEIANQERTGGRCVCGVKPTTRFSQLKKKRENTFWCVLLGMWGRVCVCIVVPHGKVIIFGMIWFVSCNENSNAFLLFNFSFGRTKKGLFD